MNPLSNPRRAVESPSNSRTFSQFTGGMRIGSSQNINLVLFSVVRCGPSQVNLSPLYRVTYIKVAGATDTSKCDPVEILCISTVQLVTVRLP